MCSRVPTEGRIYTCAGNRYFGLLKTSRIRHRAPCCRPILPFASPSASLRTNADRLVASELLQPVGSFMVYKKMLRELSVFIRGPHPLANWSSYRFRSRTLYGQSVASKYETLHGQRTSGHIKTRLRKISLNPHGTIFTSHQTASSRSRSRTDTISLCRGSNHLKEV
jgi:hypothetical protein